MHFWRTGDHPLYGGNRTEVACGSQLSSLLTMRRKRLGASLLICHSRSSMKLSWSIVTRQRGHLISPPAWVLGSFPKVVVDTGKRALPGLRARTRPMSSFFWMGTTATDLVSFLFSSLRSPKAGRTSQSVRDSRAHARLERFRGTPCSATGSRQG